MYAATITSRSNDGDDAYRSVAVEVVAMRVLVDSAFVHNFFRFLFPDLSRELFTTQTKNQKLACMQTCFWTTVCVSLHDDQREEAKPSKMSRTSPSVLTVEVEKPTI